MSNYRRPSIADWRTGLTVGAILGAVILGIGSRIGMRVIAIAQGQGPSFTFEGTLTVVLLGTATGAAVAVLFLLARTAFPNRRLARVSLFWTLLALFVWRGLNPISALNAAVFAPLFLLHGSLLTVYWCRVRFRTLGLVQAGGCLHVVSRP